MMASVLKVDVTTCGESVKLRRDDLKQNTVNYNPYDIEGASW